MSTYFIATYNVSNPDGYNDYVLPVIELLKKHKAEVLVADYEPKNIEGSNPGTYIVIRFESEEKAMNWYNDPDYAEVKKIRLENTENGVAVIAKQFELPK